MSNDSRRSVTVLRDFSYTERPGEEELAISRFLQAAPEHIEISVQPPELIKTKEPIERADVLISFGLKQYSDDVFDWVLDHPRHIHISQDWWEPLQPQASYRDKITAKAAAVIFMSPMHQERYMRIYHADPVDFHIIPFPMLESDYSAVYDVEQKEETLWCASWHPDYGNDLMLSWAFREKQHIHAMGLEVPKEQIAPLVSGLGSISLDKAALAFAPYSRFVYFPRKPIPFGFSFFLAYLLGLEMTYSGEIGCMSWLSMSTHLEKLCLKATDDFWDVVEEVAA